MIGFNCYNQIILLKFNVVLDCSILLIDVLRELWRKYIYNDIGGFRNIFLTRFVDSEIYL